MSRVVNVEARILPPLAVRDLKLEAAKRAMEFEARVDFGVDMYTDAEGDLEGVVACVVEGVVACVVEGVMAVLFVQGDMFAVPSTTLSIPA